MVSSSSHQGYHHPDESPTTASTASAGDTISVTLRLVGSDTQGSSEPSECQTTWTSSSGGNPTAVLLQVHLPLHVTLNNASTGADVLLKAMDELPGNGSVDRVELSGLVFTSQSSLDAIFMFLTIHAPSVKHLILHHMTSRMMVGGEEEEEDTNDTASETKPSTSVILDPIPRLAGAYQESRLELLDLSYNRLDATTWTAFWHQTQLQSVLLEHVFMNDASLQALEYELNKHIYTGSLVKLCISNYCSEMTASGVEAANNILYRCTNLRYLRWAHLAGGPEGTSNSGIRILPCRGLHDLALRMVRLLPQGGPNNLRHLEWEGEICAKNGNHGQEDLDAMCAALQLLNRLTHLKLSRLQLTPNQLKAVISSLKMGRAPLRVLDLSNNPDLGDEGAIQLAQLGSFRSLTMSLEALNLENTAIGTKGATALFTALGSSDGLQNLSVNMDGNPLDMSKVALALAAGGSSKAGVNQETEYNKKQMNSLLTAQNTLVSDMQALQRQIDQLTKEKETLIGAFAVMGATKAVEERNSVMERLTQLEVAVHGGRHGDVGGLSHHSKHRAPPFIDARSLTGLSDDESIASSHKPRQRPSSVRAQEVSSGNLISRNEVRARVLAEVASLQSKKDQLREAILADIHALRSQQRPLSRRVIEDSQSTGGTPMPKISTNDRSGILEDIEQLRETKRDKRTKEAGGGREQPLRMPQRQDSLRFDRLNRSHGDHHTTGSVSNLLPMSSSRSLEEGTDIASGPEITLPDSSFHSMGSSDRPRPPIRDRSFKGAQDGQPADRFQRLLHRQFQNQFFKGGPGRGDEATLTIGSQRSSDITSSSHHRNRPGVHSSTLSNSLHSQSRHNPSLRNFLEGDTQGGNLHGSSSASLPVADMYRTPGVIGLRSTTEEDEDEPNDGAGGGSSFVLMPLSGAPLENVSPAGNERRGAFQRAASMRAMGNSRGSLLRTYSGQGIRWPNEQERNLVEAYRSRFSHTHSEAKLMTASAHGEGSPRHVLLDGPNEASLHTTRDRMASGRRDTVITPIRPSGRRNLNTSTDTHE